MGFFSFGARPRLKLVILIVIIASYSIGCGFTPFYALGKKFDPQKASELIKGQSTRDDVLRLFGRPVESSTADLEKADWWRYNYVYLGNLGIERADLEVYFKDDRVEDYQVKVEKSRY
ncbi:MAG: hypothetical protein BZ151_01755 [Desulfobacca sp. 4484_104]|nr:MAG: hypothetical protein BZ151_01755 [Desulfobacca sp. 4484_104]